MRADPRARTRVVYVIGTLERGGAEGDPPLPGQAVGLDIRQRFRGALGPLA